MLYNLTTVILAGGLGTRLRSVLAARPKVLAPVNGRPFMAYLLEQLVEAGVPRVVLCIGYLGEQVQAEFGSRYGTVELVYYHEPVPLGTAGAIRQALPLFESDPVLVLNGDSYCEVNLTTFLDWHKARRAKGSLVLTHRKETGRYGRVQVAERGGVISFEEKGQGLPSTTSQPGWINAGIYLLSHELIMSIPCGRSISIERDIFPAWVGRGLYGYQGGGRFIDIGTPESYAEAESFFASCQFVVR